MSFIPLTSQSPLSIYHSHSPASPFSDADSEPVEDKIDRLTVLLQEVINLDKDAMTGTDWERMQIQIALNESMSDKLHYSHSNSFCEPIEIAEDYDEEYDLLLRDLDRAQMQLEDQRSRGPEANLDMEVDVEEDELNYFLELVTQFSEGFQGRRTTQLFYLGGKHLQVSIRGKHLTKIGHRVSRELAANQQRTQEALEVQMEAAFLNSKDSQVYVSDTTCLDTLTASLADLKQQLLDQIEQAKAVKNSYTRIKRRHTQASMEDFNKEVEMSRLNDLTSSPTPKAHPRRTLTLPKAPDSLKEPSSETARTKLEQELKSLEQQAKSDPKNVVQSQKIATRISRIKTELSRIRSEDAINASRQNSFRGLKKNYSMAIEPPTTKAASSDRMGSLMLSFNSFDEDTVLTPRAGKELPSFSVEDISVDHSFYPSNKPSYIAKQLRELNSEREELEELRLKTETEHGVQRNKLDLEWKRLETERKTFEAEMHSMQLQSATKQATKHSMIQLLCSDFLTKLEQIQA